jgi:hypothetical protein
MWDKYLLALSTVGHCEFRWYHVLINGCLWMYLHLRCLAPLIIFDPCLLLREKTSGKSLGCVCKPSACFNFDDGRWSCDALLYKYRNWLRSRPLQIEMVMDKSQSSKMASIFDICKCSRPVRIASSPVDLSRFISYFDGISFLRT